MNTPDPRLVDHIREASRILIFTGAGISTASGIRDFRGPEGVWKTRTPVYIQDFIDSEAARTESWDQKQEAWEAFKSAKPNAVHTRIAQLERAGKIEAVVTQNIDGLHARAGTSRGRLVELHGTNAEVVCLSCGVRSDPDPHIARFRATGSAPRCACGGLLKAATISFGQTLREEDLARAATAVANADLSIAMGSTLSVHPAASFPLLAAEKGAPYVIINRGPTDHDGIPSVSLRLEGDVTRIFPPVVECAIGTDP